MRRFPPTYADGSLMAPTVAVALAPGEATRWTARGKHWMPRRTAGPVDSPVSLEPSLG
jgi:hypothetical protein